MSNRYPYDRQQVENLIPRVEQKPVWDILAMTALWLTLLVAAAWFMLKMIAGASGEAVNFREAVVVPEALVTYIEAEKTAADTNSLPLPAPLPLEQPAGMGSNHQDAKGGK